MRICDCNRGSGRYTGEELEGDWFPPAQSYRLLIQAEEGRIRTGGGRGGEERGNGRDRGISENRCSDPKMVEGDSPNSETNAVYLGGVSGSLGRRSPIDLHDDMEI